MPDYVRPSFSAYFAGRSKAYSYVCLEFDGDIRPGSKLGFGIAFTPPSKWKVMVIETKGLMYLIR